MQEVLPHPPYSSDLTPTYSHFFKHINNFLQGKHFHNLQDAENAFQEFIESWSIYTTGSNKLFLVGNNVLIVMVPFWLIKMLLEPSYNNTHTKFMVWNRNYICTSLIIGLAKESVPTPESVPLAKECCILFGQARFICPFLELVGEVIPSEHMDWEQSRSPMENWGCHVEKRNWYIGNRKIKISVSKYLETDYTFCILLGASG